MFCIIFCRWLDLNCGPLLSATSAAGLPTEPQPLLMFHCMHLSLPVLYFNVSLYLCPLRTTTSFLQLSYLIVPLALFVSQYFFSFCSFHPPPFCPHPTKWGIFSFSVPRSFRAAAIYLPGYSRLLPTYTNIHIDASHCFLSSLAHILQTRQSDQMARLFVNIRPFSTVKISPILTKKGSNFCPTLFKPKTFKILPKWRNFAKSGHTDTR